jgi:hypothetical protein
MKPRKRNCTIAVAPEAGRRKHQLISEFYTGFVVGGRTIEGTQIGYDVIGYHTIPLRFGPKPGTAGQGLIGRLEPSAQEPF